MIAKYTDQLVEILPLIQVEKDQQTTSKKRKDEQEMKINEQRYEIDEQRSTIEDQEEDEKKLKNNVCGSVKNPN